MDDPIFDPWSSAAAGLEFEPRVESTQGDRPGSEGSTPSPLSENAESSDGTANRTPRWRSAAGSENRPASRRIPKPLDVSIPFAGSSRSTPPEPRETASDGLIFLREFFVPRLIALAQRLELAGHETVLDDRLDGSPPSLRFRLKPRTAPFDSPSEDAGAVLEVVLDGSGSRLISRIWLNPFGESPSEEVEVASCHATEPWLDSQLIAFVDKTLRQS